MLRKYINIYNGKWLTNGWMDIYILYIDDLETDLDVLF